MKIYLARHGQDLDNASGILNGHRDEPLTELGRSQAKEVAAKMVQAGFRLGRTTMEDSSGPANEVRLRAVFSSPLQRAHETAQIFANVLSSSSSSSSASSSEGAKVQCLQDLIERNLGIMTGRPISSILETCSDQHGGVGGVLVTEKINYFLAPPGAETFPDLILRANRLLSYIDNTLSAEFGLRDDNDDASILLVAHGDIGKMIYAAYYNLDWEQVLRQFHFGNSEVLLLSKDSPPEDAHVFRTDQFNS